MKKLCALLLCLSSLLVSAEKAENMYLMRNTELGNLFFIFENSFYSVDDKIPLLFDMTHLCSCDTISIKMTIHNPTLVDVDSVALSWSEGTYIIPSPIVIYKEKDNKYWVNRCDCVFPYSFVAQAFANEACPIFTIYTTSGIKQYKLPEKKWSKMSSNFREIFMTIQSNKRLLRR